MNRSKGSEEMHSMPNAVEKIEQLSRESERQKILIETLEAENRELVRKNEKLQKQLDDLQNAE